MKIVKVILGICCLVLMLTKCLPDKSEGPLGISNAKGDEFAGSATCVSCHQEVAEHFSQTAHAKTSSEANEETVLGSFAAGRNVFALNYYERVMMENRDTGLYQQSLHRNQVGEAGRFDIVIGSGQGGQSYLTWRKDALFQLPVSYHAPSQSWSGSPGYNDFTINFKRPVTPRCMECHATFAKSLNPLNENSNRFDKSEMILGVSCESCHGAAAKHVAYHQLHPKEEKGKFVISPAGLNRQLQLDVCGVCHSGLQENLKPPFSFAPGDSLSAYFKINNDTSNAQNLDVHGNKFALLQSSKCYVMSPEMTCSTCHNTHKNERDNPAIFIAKCQGCHTGPHKAIPVPSAAGKDIRSDTTMLTKAAISANCVSCHMPQKSSKTLLVRLQNAETATPAVLRTHHIAVYPEETANLYRYIDSMTSRF